MGIENLKCGHCGADWVGYEPDPEPDWVANIDEPLVAVLQELAKDRVSYAQEVSTDRFGEPLPVPMLDLIDIRPATCVHGQLINQAETCSNHKLVAFHWTGSDLAEGRRLHETAEKLTKWEASVQRVMRDFKVDLATAHQYVGCKPTF